MTAANADPVPPALPSDSGLEPALAAIESGLSALGEALRAHDSAAIERHADALHRALAHAVDRFEQAARAGRLPPPLRRRLASASGRVAAQRESLARATAALDRAIDVLLPRPPAALYSAQGAADRGTPQRGASLQA